jgi:protein-S-isoprenylcysteine O-methyltransferase Ste14
VPQALRPANSSRGILRRSGCHDIEYLDEDLAKMNKLVVQAVGTFLLGVFLLGLLLFLPAGTFHYWQAWLFIAVFMTSVSAIGVYLSLNDPALLERRKNIGPAAEQSPAQKIIISIGILADLGLLVFCALDYRYGWSRDMPAYVSLLGNALVALGLFINLLVFRENSYGASNIKVEEGQRVIATGPYALVRHPMYAGVLIMVVGVPLALGSWWGLAIVALVVPVLAWRILDEEKLLKKDLLGYVQYVQKVRYRLVPYLW